MSTKTQLIDGVGLTAPHVAQTLAASQDRFDYSHLSRSTEKLKAAAQAPERTKILMLLSPQHLGKLKQAIPSSLRKSILIAVVATPEELRHYGQYTDLLDEESVFDVIEKPVSEPAFRLLLKKAELTFVRRAEEDAAARLKRTDVQRLHEIGVWLSGQTDVESLTDTIANICIESTKADAFCFYLLTEREGLGYDKTNYLLDKELHFRYDRKNSVLSFRRDSLTADGTALSGAADITANSLPGYVTLMQEVLRIADAYQLPADKPYTVSRQHDTLSEYRTKSLLLVPVVNREGQTVGVIQLCNKRKHADAALLSPDDVEKHVIGFTEEDEQFVVALALQASIAYENLRLYDSVRALLEGFIKASVTAIEQRDPTTSGHSGRVATLTVAIAETVDRVSTGIFKDAKFNRRDLKEIEYASLLHDFGKIGVRESVLVKEKKLYEHELQAITGRFETVRKAIQLKFANRKLALTLEHGRERALPDLHDLDAECRQQILELDRDLIRIMNANEPSPVKGRKFDELKEIRRKLFVFDDHEQYEYLTSYEMSRLSIEKGTLSPEEREEIQSHVSHTFDFLRQIPWTNDLRQIPLIAYAHHEKLDGTGYPNGLPGEAIPLQSRMMTISDIYDALTAADRPYKRALSNDRALDILGMEVKEDKVDPDLFDLFVRAELFKVVKSSA